MENTNSSRIDSLSDIKNNKEYIKYMAKPDEIYYSVPNSFVECEFYNTNQRYRNRKTLDHTNNDQLFTEKLIEILKAQEDRIENIASSCRKELNDRLENMALSCDKKTDDMALLCRKELNDRLESMAFLRNEKMIELYAKIEDNILSYVEKIEKIEDKNLSYVEKLEAKIEDLENNAAASSKKMESMSKKHIKIIREIQHKTQNIVPSKIVLSPTILYATKLKPSKVNLLFAEKKRWFVSCQQYLDEKNI